MGTHTVAAIDIGSNSLKLVVAEGGDGSFTVLKEDRERLRLGQETQRSGRISDELTARSVETMARFRAISEESGAEEILAVATASLRAAENQETFIKEVERQTGIRVRVITSQEEARLIGISAVAYFGKSVPSILNIDIGGGSTELSLFENEKAKQLHSMGIGAVTLTEKCVKSDPPSLIDLGCLATEISEALREPLECLKGEEWSLTSATSGTCMHIMGLLHFESGSNQTPEIQLERLWGLNRILVGMTIDQRAKLPGISTHRAEVLIAGAFILEKVMSSLKVDSIRPCGYSLREGVVLDYIKTLEASSAAR